MPPPPIVLKPKLNAKLIDQAVSQATLSAQAVGELHSKVLAVPHKYPTYAEWINYEDPPIPDKPPPLPPPPPPTQLGPFNSGTITFDNGVPVGGWISLVMFQDGSYSFNGHFHVSGAPSYDVEVAWVIVTDSGRALSFAANGKLHGFLQPGSRNWDFNLNGANDIIRDHWLEFTGGYSWRWTVNVNWNVADALNALVEAMKTAGTVITTVTRVVG